MNKSWIFPGAGLVAYGAVVIYADPLLLSILVHLGLWIAAACAGAALVILLFAAVTRRLIRPPLVLLSGFIATASLIWLTLPINGFIQERAVAAAKAYPDRVAPLLEHYRQQHGTYPTRLDQLPSRPCVPRLLRTKYGYCSDGQRYTFTFDQPGGMIDVWDYSSETHTWHLST